MESERTFVRRNAGVFSLTDAALVQGFPQQRYFLFPSWATVDVRKARVTRPAPISGVSEEAFHEENEGRRQREMREWFYKQIDR